MDKTLLINVIWFLVCFVLSVVAQFVRAYLKAKGEVTEEAAHQIAVAEDVFATVEKAGEKKMQLCIDALYGMVPAPVKLFLTREMIGEIVQKVFDQVEKYKDVWIEAAAESIIGKLPEEEPEEAPAE